MIKLTFQFLNLSKELLKVKKRGKTIVYVSIFNKIVFCMWQHYPSCEIKTKQRRMIMESILETVMLVCFGFSWPLNVVKAYRAKTAKGTSLPFILLIITGYIAGISAKLISGQINYVLIAYILNLAIVSLNVIVYFRNVSLDKKRLQGLEV